MFFVKKKNVVIFVIVQTTYCFYTCIFVKCFLLHCTILPGITSSFTVNYQHKQQQTQRFELRVCFHLQQRLTFQSRSEICVQTLMFFF